MQRQPPATRASGDESTPVVEDVHLRNYDFAQAYDLELHVRDENGETVLDRRFFARPGWSRSLEERLPPGEYEVAVTLDRDVTERATCRIDEYPEHSVLIECGNGSVNVSQGIY